MKLKACSILLIYKQPLNFYNLACELGQSRKILGCSQHNHLIFLRSIQDQYEYANAHSTPRDATFTSKLATKSSCIFETGHAIVLYFVQSNHQETRYLKTSDLSAISYGISRERRTWGFNFPRISVESCVRLIFVGRILCLPRHNFNWA